MSSHNYLWAVDNCGHAHTLSTRSHLWQQRSHTTDANLVEFKKITASRHCAWALGCNQELYVYVYPSDVPIRCLEYTYENQRWNPVHGFSQRALFPTDRLGWSDEKGVRILPCPHDVKLPSSHWTWENEWHVDASIKGKPTGKGGWQYAVNYNSREHFTPEKHWNSCVRRRKWIRYRKFKATDIWAVLPGLCEDALEEPFHDIAIGGYELPGQPEGYLSVWTITALGKVYCRTDVNCKCPEGIDWAEMNTPGNVGLVQISVGPSGIVWGVTWDGLAIVRTGVSRDRPLGTGWQYVAPPEESGLGQVAVGFNVVWAVSRDNKVWFRQGFEAIRALVDNEACTGTSWVEMVGKMAAISVGPNDQVWALGFVDRLIYFRSAVTYEELSGRSWKLIDVHDRSDRSLSTSSYDVSSLYGSMSSLSTNTESYELSPRYEDYQRKVRSVTLPAQSLGTRPIIPGAEEGQRNALGNEVRTIGSQISSSDETPSSHEVDLHPMLVRAQWKPTAGDRDPIVGEKFKESPLSCNRDRNAKTRKSRRLARSGKANDRVSTDDTSKDDLNMSKQCRVSDPTAASISDGEGVTLSELRQDQEARQLSRQDSYSSDYSDTVINFLDDDGEPVDDVVTENTKGTQTGEIAAEEAIADDPAAGQLTAITLSSRTRSATVCAITIVEPETEDDHRLPNGDVLMKDSGREEVLSEDHLAADSPDYNGHGSFSDLTSSGEGGCLLWVYVSGGGCTIDPTSLPKWFEQSMMSNVSLRHKLSEGSWREQILTALKERREHELSSFANFPLAVERTIWVKVGRMQWYSEGRRRQWLHCTVELQRGVDGKGLEESTLTCHYNSHDKPKQIQLKLSEITCMLEVSDFEHPAFSMYTAKRVLERRPVKLRASNDTELREWISALSLACLESRCITGQPSCRAAWAITTRGDVFVYDPLPTMESAPSSLMYWHQIGGHMALIESCPAGVVWGLGMDNTPWVYSEHPSRQGYTGPNARSNSNTQTDHRNVCIFENQKWNPILGFTDRTFPINETGWTDGAGRMEYTKEAINPPNRHWQWISEWRIDFTVSGSTDPEGWQYAKDYKSRRCYHKDKRWNDCARRRRWIRKCQLVTTGPWMEMPNLPLKGLSMQPDVDEDWDGPIALWAIGANGDVVTRLGVTRHCPEGHNWLHVPSDQPFQSISVGGKYRVWGIAKDGSAFYRNGIHEQNPTGDVWFHIALPVIAPLVQISCGTTTVWAIDSHMNLWFRENITPTFPEGTRWILVSSKVREVTVGPQDQVWVIADEVNGSTGVICRRDGISVKRPTGTSWDKGAGGGFIHLTVRACTRERSTTVQMDDIAKATVQGQGDNSHDGIIKPYTSSKDNVLC